MTAKIIDAMKDNPTKQYNRIEVLGGAADDIAYVKLPSGFTRYQSAKLSIQTAKGGCVSISISATMEDPAVLQSASCLWTTILNASTNATDITSFDGPITGLKITFSGGTGLGRAIILGL